MKTIHVLLLASFCTAGLGAQDDLTRTNFASAYRKETQTVRPGFYEVTLDDTHAKVSIAAEIPDWNLVHVRDQARAEWNAAFACRTAEGGAVLLDVLLWEYVPRGALTVNTSGWRAKWHSPLSPMVNSKRELIVLD